MGYYPAFRRAIPQKGADSYILLSRPPLLSAPHSVRSFEGAQLDYSLIRHAPNVASSKARSEVALDLHISGTPLAFILSQDQTLKKIRIRPKADPNPITRLNPANCQSAQ